jgi:hypothetical protein
VITCTQFKRNYMDAIDMWDATRRVGWVCWLEVWGKRLGLEGARKPIYTAKRRPNQSPPSWFVVLNLRDLCEEGSGPNLDEN